MAETRQTLLVVGGMHRSGTSALSGALSAAGVNFGDNLLGAAEDNKKGFFEDRQLVECNEHILHSLLQSWDTVAPLEIDQQSQNFLTHRKAAAALVNDLIRQAPVSGIKDPRVSLLIPFWHAAFNQLELDAHWLLCVRSPQEVATSLYHRNRFSIEKSIALWLKYTLSFLEALSSLPKPASLVTVDFAQSLEDPGATFEKVKDAFSLSNLNEEKFLAFYNRALITAQDEIPLQPNNALIDLAMEVYLHLVSESHCATKIQSFCNRWHALEPIVRFVDYQYQALDNLAEKDRQWVVGLERQLIEKTEQLAKLDSLFDLTRRLEIAERENRQALMQASKYHENWSISRMEARQALQIAKDKEQEAWQNHIALREVYQSTSWKFSYPVRLGKRVLRRITGNHDG